MDTGKWEELFKPYSVTGGELLVTKLGEPPGVTAIYPTANGPAMLTPDVIKMEVNEALALPRFLMHYFNSPVAKRLASIASFGTTRLRLTLPIFRDLPVPLPPLNEQARIVEEVERRLSVIGNLESGLDLAFSRAETLRRSILKNAFAGQLTQQNVEDESAANLLEQIRKARGNDDDGRPRRGRGVRREASPPGPETGTPDVMSRKNQSGRHKNVETPFEASSETEASKTPKALATSDPVPTLGEANFLDLPREEQIDHVWESLLGQGPLDKDAAIRTAAQILRDRGLVQFQRLREGGPLHAAIAAAVDRGIREGSFDRPKRGLVRALLPDAKDYTAKEWTLCLLQSLDGQPVPQEDALRNAAEWARETLGLAFARLREDGVILRGLKAALDGAVKSGEVIRKAGMVSCPSD
jgi:hypothetical protein